jgi:hypothetical protein
MRLRTLQHCQPQRQQLLRALELLGAPHRAPPPLLLSQLQTPQEDEQQQQQAP